VWRAKIFSPHLAPGDLWFPDCANRTGTQERADPFSILLPILFALWSAVSNLSALASKVNRRLCDWHKLMGPWFPPQMRSSAQSCQRRLPSLVCLITADVTCVFFWGNFGGHFDIPDSRMMERSNEKRENNFRFFFFAVRFHLTFQPGIKEKPVFRCWAYSREGQQLWRRNIRHTEKMRERLFVCLCRKRRKGEEYINKMKVSDRFFFFFFVFFSIQTDYPAESNIHTAM
jgi:hypothetical protein